MNWEDHVQQNGVMSITGDYQKPIQQKKQQIRENGGNTREDFEVNIPQNGRVVFLNGRHSDIEDNPVKQQFKNPFMVPETKQKFKGSLGNITSETPLSKLFFSAENIKALQTLIRYNVYLKSNRKYVIGEQSTIDLEVEMRAIYLQFAKFLDYNLIGQVKELNQHVIEHIVPQIITQIKQYEGFVDSVENLPVPISHPINVSNKGSKILPPWLH